MTLRKTSPLWMTLGIAALIGAASCDDNPAAGSGTGSYLSDPANLEQFARVYFEDAANGVIDGAARLILAIETGSAPGVTLTPDGGGGFTASVAVDLDGNGTTESTIDGGYSFPVVSVTSVTDPTLPGLTASGSAQLSYTMTDATVAAIAGTMEADPPGPENHAVVNAESGSITVNFATGNPTGTVQMSIVADGQLLTFSVTFQADGSGGWEARFQGSGFDFTIP